MGLDVMGLMALLQGGSSMMGQAGNMRSQGLSQLDTIMDMVRYAQRNRDPLFNQVRQYSVNQFNESPYGPFGDVGGGFDSIWGTRSDGSPVQYGDMAARQYDYMLNNNPGNAALSMLGGLQDQIWGSSSGSGAKSAGVGSSPVMGTSVSGLGPVSGGTTVTGLGDAPGPEPVLTMPSGGIGGGGAGGDIMGALRDRIAGALRGGGSGGGGSLSSMFEPGDRLNIARNLMAPGNPYPTSFNGGGDAPRGADVRGFERTPMSAATPTWVADSYARTRPNTSSPGREHLRTVAESIWSKKRAA